MGEAKSWDSVDNEGLPPSVKAAWITLAVAWAMLFLPFPFLSGLLGSLFCSISMVISIVAIAQGHAGIGIIQLLVNVIGSIIVWFLSVFFWLTIVGIGAGAASEFGA